MLHAAGDAAKRLDDSADMLTEIMSAPDKGIPQDLLEKAQCVVLVPGLKKGAFIVGAKYGKGFMLCRKQSGVGWSAPAAIRVEGGSFGFQIGGSETDVVMLVNSEPGAKKLLASKFTLGADASVAAGPVGRTSSAETDAQLHAEILRGLVRAEFSQAYRCKARRCGLTKIGTRICMVRLSRIGRSSWATRRRRLRPPSCSQCSISIPAASSSPFTSSWTVRSAGEPNTENGTRISAIRCFAN